MGFLERAIRRGVSNAVEKAVGNAVQKKVEPKATELANKAADAIDNAAQNASNNINQAQNTSGLNGAFANLERSMQNYATEAAQRAVEQYRQILLVNGFRQAGQYPSIEQLFKRIDGVVYNVDTEHCFEGDPDFATIGFCIREPYGGFDYVKPEPKKKTSFLDLFK